MQAYAQGRAVNPVEFFEKNQRDGWTIGGEPIRNWRAIFDAWEKREQIPETTKSGSRPEYFDRIQDAIDHENDMDPAERQKLEDDIHLAQEALRNCSTLEEASRYYHERTKL